MMTFISLVSEGQIGEDLEIVFRAGPEDAERYLEKYMEPGIISFGNGLAGGWMNTAETHKLLGFDFTLSANVATIPDEALTFRYGDVSKWSNLRVSDGGHPALPTIGGGDTDEQLFLRADAQINDPTGEQPSINYTGESDDFTAASGVGAEDIPFNGIPTPTFNLGIGLFKNTDLKVRWVPTQSTDDFELSMWGVGVMHDIKQWIPGLKLVPIDIAGLVGTTSLSSKIEYEFESDGSGDQFETQNGSTEYTVNSTTIQIMASKKLSVFTPYASVGYNFISSTLDVKGRYIYTNEAGESIELDDPLSIDFNNNGSPRMTIGGRLKLLVLTLHADYTIQEYNMFTAGVGIAVR